MKRLIAWLLISVACISLFGCLNNTSNVIVAVEEAGFEITVPSTWIVTQMDSLLIGLEFYDSETGSSLSGWILHGDSTGRSLDEQLSDLQAVMAFVLDPADSITGWNQGISAPFTIGGRTGRRAEADYFLTGVEMHVVAAVISHQGKDVLMIGQCGSYQWENAEEEFDEAFGSLMFTD